MPLSPESRNYLVSIGNLVLPLLLALGCIYILKQMALALIEKAPDIGKLTDWILADPPRGVVVGEIVIAAILSTAITFHHFSVLVTSFRSNNTPHHVPTGRKLSSTERLLCIGGASILMFVAGVIIIVRLLPST